MAKGFKSLTCKKNGKQNSKKRHMLYVQIHVNARMVRNKDYYIIFTAQGKENL